MLELVLTTIKSPTDKIGEERDFEVENNPPLSPNRRDDATGLLDIPFRLNCL